MSSPLSAKRRKNNHAANILSKPFVSPLRSARPDQTLQKEAPPVSKQTYTPSTLAHSVSSQDLTESPTEVASSALPIASRLNAASTQKQLTPLSTLRRTDPAVIAAQRVCTALELQIKALRNDIDTLTQGAKTSASNKATELEDLTTKWRAAAQQAAEELFGTVKERVCRMGGVAAWREAEQQKFNRAHGLGEFREEVKEGDDDADCEFDEEGEELPEEEQEFRKKEKRRVRREMAEAAEPVERDEGDEGGGGKVLAWQEEGKDDDVSLVFRLRRSLWVTLTVAFQAFTMDMMLRSLNIELKVIGYDKHSQRWEA